MEFNTAEHREFHTSKEANSWGEKHYKEWSESYKKNDFQLDAVFPDAENKVIECYCGFSYRDMNRILRYPNCNAEPKYKIMNQLLAMNIMWAPRLPENIVVYRGVPISFVNELHQPLNQNGWVCEKGFLSTSLISTIEMDHGYDALLRIYLSKGIPGAYVSCVTDRSEHEFLSVPNIGIRLMNEKEKSDHFFKERAKSINGYEVYDCLHFPYPL